MRIERRFDEAAGAYRLAWEQLKASRSLEGARIRKWQGVVAYELGAISDARSLLGEALKTLDAVRRDSSVGEARAEELTRETAHCHFNLAQLEYSTAHFTASLSQFDEALALYHPGSEDWADCALARALLCLRIPGREAEASELIEQATTILKSANRGPAGAGLLSRVRAEAALMAGDWAVAESIVAPALQSLAPSSVPADIVATAELLALLGRTAVAAGDLGTAHNRITDAIDRLGRLPPLVRGSHALVTSARLDLAILALARGDVSQSIATLRELEEEITRGERQLEEARWLDALGSGYQATGQLTFAADYHYRAGELYGAAEFSKREETISRVNLACDHLLTKKARYVKRAARLLTKCAHKLARLDRDGRELARCRANLGVALAILGDLDSAEDALEASIVDYARSGLWLEQTIPRHNHGVIQVERALTGDPSDATRRLDRALDDLVPAFLVRDSARFDHTIPRHRRAWWTSQSAKTLSLSLRVATIAERPELVAELIATARLSGGLTVGSRVAARNAAQIGDLVIAGTIDSDPSLGSDDVLSREDSLVLVPGSHVAMFGNRLALREYFSTIAKEQTVNARLIRSGSVIELV
jgi:tetratricopeptide (TPR) repeat protein